jgi:outer membrane immunogenic protein
LLTHAVSDSRPFKGDRRFNLTTLIEGHQRMRIVSLLIVWLLGVGAMTASAQAADLGTGPVTKAPPAYVPLAPTWAGFYIGAHLGGAWSEADWTTPVTGAGVNSSSSGVLGGAQAGYNWQAGSVVWGFEGDFSGTSLQSSNTGPGGFANTTSTYWTSTVTGRLGYAFDRTLVYAKGGLAIADERDSVTSPLGALSSSTGATAQTGWTAGGGLEYALTPHWSAKVEYDYLGFGSQSVPAAAAGGAPGSVDLNIQRVIGGINYRF